MPPKRTSKKNIYTRRRSSKKKSSRKKLSRKKSSRKKSSGGKPSVERISRKSYSGGNYGVDLEDIELIDIGDEPEPVDDGGIDGIDLSDINLEFDDNELFEMEDRDKDFTYTDEELNMLIKEFRNER